MIFKSKHGEITVREIHRFEKTVPYRNSFTYRMQHTVQVKFNNEKAQFQFTSSIADYQAGKDKLSDKDLLYALSSFLEDGLYSINNFEDFCGDFGYEVWGDDPDKTDPDTGYNKESLKVYEDCEKLKSRAERIGITTDMAYDIIDELREAEHE